MPDPQKTGHPAAPTVQSSKGNVFKVRYFTTKNLSVIISGVVAITALLKADSADIPKIVETLADSKETAVVGWSFVGIVIVTSVVFVRLLIKIHDREIERIARERDQLQTKLLKLINDKSE